MRLSQIQKKLPPFGYNLTVLSLDQTTGEIITEVLRKHQECKPHYDLIAAEFEGDDAPQKLFKFCQKNLPYYIEPAGEQSTLTPGGIIEIGSKRGVDCKHYANFIAGVLDALNRIGYTYDISYRFAGYRGKIKDHVFIVVKDDDGSETWIDPTPIQAANGYSMVKRSFNDRAAIPASYTDKKIPMALVTINGLAQYGAQVGYNYYIDENGQRCGVIPTTNPTQTVTPVPKKETSILDVAKTDPQVGAFVEAAQQVIDILPDGGLKNFLKDYLKNPINAFRRLYFGKPFTSGSYHLGEIFMRNILGKPEIQNRGQVPDSIVPQAHQFFTTALGVRIGSEDHIDELAKSPQNYIKWLGQDAADIPLANIERAHRILKAIGYPQNQADGRRNKKWDLATFEIEPYVYPMVGHELNSMLTGTNPINNTQIQSGYPVNQLPVDENGNPVNLPSPSKAGVSTFVMLALIGAGAYMLFKKPSRKTSNR